MFEHSKDGKVERILRAAITNNPALINLPALARSEDAGLGTEHRLKPVTRPVKTMAKADGEKMKLSEVMAVLEKAYPDAAPEKLMKAAACLMADDGDDGAEPDGDEGEDMDAAGGDPYEKENSEQMAARQADEMAKCASDADKAEMAKKHMAQKGRFAKRTAQMSQHPHPSLSRKEAGEGRNLDAVIAKHPMVVKMAGEINSMRGAQAKAAATQKVDAAIREGRLIPSQREWAIAYCASASEGFENFIAAQPRIIQQGPDGTFTGRLGDPPQGVSSLSVKEIDIFANLGLESEEQLKKCAAIKDKWTLKFPRPRMILDDSNSGQPQGK